MSELTSSDNLFYGVGFSVLIGIVSFGIVFMSKNSSHCDSNDTESKPFLDNTKKNKKSKKKKAKKSLSYAESESSKSENRELEPAVIDSSSDAESQDSILASSSQCSKCPERCDVSSIDKPMSKSAQRAETKRNKKKKKKQKLKQKRNQFVQKTSDKIGLESVGCQTSSESELKCVKHDVKLQTAESMVSIANLGEEKAMLQKKVAELEENYDSQTTDLKLSNQLLKIADNRADKLSKQLKTNQLDYVSREKQYAADRDNITKEMNHMKREMSSMADRNRELNDRIAEYEEQIDHWKAEVATREGANIRSEIQNTELASRLELLEAELSAARSKITDLEDQVELQETRYKQKMEKEKHSLEQTEELLTTIQNSVDDEVDKWKHEFFESQEELGKLRLEYEDQMTTSIVSISEEDDDVTDLNFAYTCMEKSLSGIVDEMNNRITDLEGQCEDLKKERDEQSRYIEELLRCIDCDFPDNYFKENEDILQLKSPRIQLSNRFTDFLII